MIVTVASGKGGTGKTLVATHLARRLVEADHRALYVDADVEEPNGHLLLDHDALEEREVRIPCPVMRRETCSGCGICQKVCAFGAILATAKDVLVMEKLCHACGACALACPERALTERPRRLGLLRSAHSGDLAMLWGVVDVGEPRAVPIVEALLHEARTREERIAIVDAPPGTACLAAEAVRDATLAVLVTEPTPMGRHDVVAAARLAKTQGVPAVAVLNRADLGDESVRRDLLDLDVPIVAEIPFEPVIATATARGGLVDGASPALDAAIDRLRSVVERRRSA